MSRWTHKSNGYCRFGRHLWRAAHLEPFNGTGEPVLVLKCKRCPAETVDVAGVWR